MGYTTKFNGSIKLSRQLTMGEAKQLLEFNEDPDKVPAPHPNSYMQWVPGSTLDCIGWDGGEKFYEYAEWLQWIVLWLAARGISSSGILSWSGEQAGDTGTLTVIDGRVESRPAGSAPVKFKPMTLRDLAEMALEQLTQPGRDTLTADLFAEGAPQ